MGLTLRTGQKGTLCLVSGSGQAIGTLFVHPPEPEQAVIGESRSQTLARALSE